MKNLTLKIVFAILFPALLSCSESNPLPGGTDLAGSDHLIEAKFLETLQKSDIRKIVKEHPLLASYGQRISNDVFVYRVTYPTNYYDNSRVIASGLVFLPAQTETASILSYQHGTIIDPGEIPSAWNPSLELNQLLITFASMGSVVSIPDYLGYGSSASLEHPFEHSKTMGSSTFDALLAVKEMMEIQGVTESGKLFLAGYSQGGYATMALHRHIEENSDFKISLSIPAAGSYNKSGTIEALYASTVQIENPGAWLWNIDVLNKTSQINRPWNQILTDHNAQLANQVSNPMQFPITPGFDHDPYKLFHPEFIEGLVSGSDREFISAFEENDLHNWSPTFPLILVYGEKDESVHPFHALSAFENFKSNGASVQIKPIADADHSAAVIPYWNLILEKFEERQ